MKSFKFIMILLTIVLIEISWAIPTWVVAFLARLAIAIYLIKELVKYWKKLNKEQTKSKAVKS